MTKVSLLRRLLDKGTAIASHLTTFRYGTVMIYRHTEFHDLKCQAEIRQVNWNNVDDALHMESPAMVAQFHKFLQHGDIGYYAYFNEAVLHRSWIQCGPGMALCELGVKFRLHPGEYYVHYCKTHPAVQGQGIYTAVLGQIANDMYAQNKEILIATVKSNPSSIRAIEKAGFRLIRRVRSIVCFGVAVLKIERARSI